MKLRAELLNKNKEISILKVQNNQKDDEHRRILRVLEEILKQCNQSTGTGFKALESIIHSKKQKQFVNRKEEKNNNKEGERMEEIRQMIHLNVDKNNTLRDIIYI